MFIAVLALLGLVLGSFVNALVWRLRQQEKSLTKKEIASLSILNGRSMCVYCRHKLAAKDLVPVFSWLSLRGKCRYCGKPIDDNPLVEIALAAAFTTSYLWWPGDLALGGQKVLFVSWLICLVGLLALLVYDLKWMLLPNKIIYPVLAVAIAGRLSYILFFSKNYGHDFWLLAGAVAVASGIFWLLYTYSKGRWIGFGDVRLGLVTGTLLASPALALAMIFMASVMGTVFALPALLAGKKALASRIPYGPFLIAATYIMVLFGQRLVDWYARLLT